jgi:membrane protease YdiL (CAAX protease family)
MKKTKKEGAMIMALVIGVCLAMAFVEIAMAPGYAAKSGIKALLFLGAPALFLLLSKQGSVSDLFRMKKGGWRFSALLAAGTFLGILGIYFLFGGFFDFSSVTPTLESQLGISGDNFIWVALYISFVNSLLEEFFFRGFAFLTLLRSSGRKTAYLFSASSFALYHVAIMNGWFAPGLMILLIGALFLAGVLFDYLDEKKGSILPSWMVHISANFAINTIGFILLGMIPGL